MLMYGIARMHAHSALLRVLDGIDWLMCRPISSQSPRQIPC